MSYSDYLYFSVKSKPKSSANNNKCWYHKEKRKYFFFFCLRIKETEWTRIIEQGIMVVPRVHLNSGLEFNRRLPKKRQ